MDTSLSATALALALVLALVLGLGLAIGATWATARSRAAVAAAQAEAAAGTSHWQARLTAAETRAEQATEVAALVAPLRQSLAELQASVQRADAARAAGVGRLESHLNTMAQEQRQVARQTSTVAAALHNPGVRGRWGEVQLTRIVESAGLLEGITFHVQQGHQGGQLRPDMVIDLGARRRVVIDAKVPLDALLTAYEDSDGRAPDPAALRAHAQAVRARIKDLAGKNYADHLPQAPDFVVLFLPADELLSTALRADAAIIEDAAQAGVILATPTTLMTLLRVLALSWQEERSQQNAAELLDLASQAVQRVGLLADHLQTLGDRLDAALAAYNKVAGSWQSRVRPVARKLADIGPEWEPLGDLAALDSEVRRIDRLPETG